MNIADKNSTPRVTPLPGKTRRSSGTPSVAGRVFSLALEVPPAVYITATGEAPTWVRIWTGVWLSVWLVATVIQAAQVQVSKGSR